MPRFSYNGTTYDVADKDLASFQKDFPNAVTQEQRGDKTYNVKASDYDKFLQDFPTQRQQPTNTVEDAVQANQGYLWQEQPQQQEETNPFRRWLSEQLQDVQNANPLDWLHKAAELQTPEEKQQAEQPQQAQPQQEQPQQETPLSIETLTPLGGKMTLEEQSALEDEFNRNERIKTGQNKAVHDHPFYQDTQRIMTGEYRQMLEDRLRREEQNREVTDLQNQYQSMLDSLTPDQRAEYDKLLQQQEREELEQRLAHYDKSIENAKANGREYTVEALQQRRDKVAAQLSSLGLQEYAQQTIENIGKEPTQTPRANEPMGPPKPDEETTRPAENVPLTDAQKAQMEKQTAYLDASTKLFDAQTTAMVEDFKQRTANSNLAWVNGGRTVPISIGGATFYTNVTGNVYPSKVAADMENKDAKSLIQKQVEGMRERDRLEAELPLLRAGLVQAKQDAAVAAEAARKNASERGGNVMNDTDRQFAEAQAKVDGLEKQISAGIARLGEIDEDLANNLDPTIEGEQERLKQKIETLQGMQYDREKQLRDEGKGTVVTPDGSTHYNYTGDRIWDALDLALKIANNTDKDLQEEADRQAGQDVGFLRGAWRTAKDLDTWLFGLPQLYDALVKLDIASGNYTTPEEVKAAEAVYEELYRGQSVESEYGNNRSLWYSGGQMTVQMVPFMLDFFIAGGPDLVTRGISRVATGLGERMVGKEVATAIEKGAIRYIAENGWKGLGREAEYFLARNTGVLLSDLYSAGKIMLTTQPANVAADIIEGKLGDVRWNEDTGQYEFSNDASWTHAIWTALMDNWIENYSEKFGTHIDWIFSQETAGRLAGLIGAKRLSRQILQADAGTLGDIMRQTQKMYNRVGISDIFGEISEEYVGQGLRSLFNIDTAFYTDENGERRNLFTSSDFHAEIWSGMAMSMGLMEVGRHGINYRQYRRVVKGLKERDRVAAASLGQERWDELRERINNSTNDDIAGVMREIFNESGMSYTQQKATLDYIAQLMAMRGMNLAQQRLAAEQQQAAIDIRNASGVRQQNEYYLKGYDTTDGAEQIAIRNLLSAAARRLNQVMGTLDDGTVVSQGIIDQINAMIDDPEAIREFIASHPEWNDEQRFAVAAYANCKQQYDGMIQRSSDDIDATIAEEKAKVDNSVNVQSGTIIGATMKADDRKVFIINGTVVPFSDRSGINAQESDQSVVVMDQNTGKIEMVATSDILTTDDQAVDPEERKREIEENMRQQLSEEASKQMKNEATYDEGTTYTVTIGGKQAEITITPNEEGIIDNGDGTVNVTMEGVEGVVPMLKSFIQQEVDNQGLRRAFDAMGWDEEDDEQGQAPWETADTPQKYEKGTQIRLYDKDGNEAVGTIVASNDAAHNYEYEVEINGKVDTYTEEELDAAYISTINENNPDEEPPASTGGAAVEEGENQPVPIVTRVEEGEEGTTTTTQTDDPSQLPNSALAQIPIDEQGEPIYEDESVSPQLAWDGLVEQCGGDTDMAQTIANNKKDKANQALEEARAALEQPTQSTRTKEMIAEIEARRAAVAAAEIAANKWTAIAKERATRAKARAQEEYERENGTPEMISDTPQRSRERGYTMHQGQRVDRQEQENVPLVEGKAVSIRFKSGENAVMQDGKVALIDASQLQPSHLDGRRNPRHFLPEAQPKRRTEYVSQDAARRIAQTLNLPEVTGSITAFTGAPVINTRGEVIQGNNRAAALKQLWEDLPEKAAEYKEYLKAHAEEFGLTAEQIDQMKNPILVNVVDVDDEKAIELGQYTAQDTESGGEESIRPKAAMRLLVKKGLMDRFVRDLLKPSEDAKAETESILTRISNNALNVLKEMAKVGIISNNQYRSALNAKGKVTEEAKNKLEEIIYQNIFGDNPDLKAMFYDEDYGLPVKAQSAILATAWRDNASPDMDTMIEEIRKSIEAFYELSKDKGFSKAKNLKDARAAIEAWKTQWLIDEQGNYYSPEEKFSNFALELAARYKGETQKAIQGIFHEMYDLIQGAKQDNIFETVDKTPKSLAQAIREVLNIDYNGQFGSDALGRHVEENPTGRQGSTGSVENRERNSGEEGDEVGGRGVEGNSGEGGLNQEENPTTNSEESANQEQENNPENNETRTSTEEQPAQQRGAETRRTMREARQRAYDGFVEQLKQDVAELGVPVTIAGTREELLAAAHEIDPTGGLEKQINDVFARGRIPQGFAKNGKVVIFGEYIFNNDRVKGSQTEALQVGREMLAHEAIAHVGLRRMMEAQDRKNHRALGTTFRKFCDDVFKGMPAEERQRFIAYHWENNMTSEARIKAMDAALADDPTWQGMTDEQKAAIAAQRWDKLTVEQKAAILGNEQSATELQRGAADEYVASLAEKVERGEELTEQERSVWQRIMDAIKRFFGAETAEGLSPQEIAEQLRKSREFLRNEAQNGGEAQLLGEDEVRNSVVEGEEQERQPMSIQEIARELSTVQGQQEAGEQLELDPAEENELRFRISNRQREQMWNTLNKRRPDMTEKQKQALMDYLDTFDDEENASVLQQALFKWFVTKNLRFGMGETAEDLDDYIHDARQAVEVALKNKQDPTAFESPQAILDVYVDTKPTEPRTDPDSLPEYLKNKKDLGNGITVYDVVDGKANDPEVKKCREALREIIDTHWGKNANPWCLLARDKDGSFAGERAWDGYSSVPKRIAFKDGKLLAFCASSSGRPEWWNRIDASFSAGIPVMQRIEGDKLGRVATYIVDENTGEWSEPRFIHTGNTKNGPYKEWRNADPNSIEKEGHYTDGKQTGEWKFYYPNGQLRQECVYEDNRLRKYKKYYEAPQGVPQVVREEGEFNENGKPVGKYVLRFTAGDIELEGQYNENGKKVGEWKSYFANYKHTIDNIHHYDDDGLESGIQEGWFRNGMKRYENRAVGGVYYGISLNWNEDGTLYSYAKFASGEDNHNVFYKFKDGRISEYNEHNPSDNTDRTLYFNNVGGLEAAIISQNGITTGPAYNRLDTYTCLVVNYEDNMPNGLGVRMSVFGAPFSISRFVNGEARGEQKNWNKDGTPISHLIIRETDVERLPLDGMWEEFEMLSEGNMMPVYDENGMITYHPMTEEDRKWLGLDLPEEEAEVWERAEELQEQYRQTEPNEEGTQFSVQENQQAEEVPQNEDLFAQAERIASDYQRQREENTRFYVNYERVMARDDYERKIRSGWYQTVEAMQDSMLSLKWAMEKIFPLKKGQHIEDIPAYMNAYIGENALSSVNQAEAEVVARRLFAPLLKEVAKLAPSEQENKTLIDYMMAKHGLERNAYMAERAARQAFADYQAKNPMGPKTLADFINEARQKDYAGLTSLTGTDNVYDAELAAEQMVDDYETLHDTTKLWQRTRAVTDAILSKQYECGLMSRATYDRIKGMYQNYIPLRGFDEPTAEEEYAYLLRRGGGMIDIDKPAKGRKSKADDPFVNMRVMMETSIMRGNRNMLVKQRFMNFVMNHPSDLVSVSDLWLERDLNTGEWVPQFPPINENDTPAQIQQKCEQFETDMTAKAAADPSRYVKQSDRPDIPYRVVSKSDLKEHQVIVSRNGRDYVLTVNGSPRLAQALNGLTGPGSGEFGKFGDALISSLNVANRFLSAAYTTRNPDFIVSNFFRDMIYSNTMVHVKETGKYAMDYHKNYAKTNPVMMNILLERFRNGTLNMNNTLDRQFFEFMTGGGETGYASIRDIEKHRNEIQRELKKYAGRMPIGKAFDYLGERFDELNRSVELCARFAAFVTSREHGRTISRSVYDAKEISVNFNKKGSGSTFFRATGQTRIGNLASGISAAGRLGYVFWNASMQGMTNFGKQFGRHPAKAITAAATMYMLGAMASLLGNMGGGGGDDEGDENAYWNIPDYLRRTNLMFRTGGYWISIPLPIEFRAVYGMGELMSSILGGHEYMSKGDVAQAMAAQLSQILPLDFLEGGGGATTFVPSVARPVVEALINKKWTGAPLYNDSPYLNAFPEYRRAYRSANPTIVGATKWLNEVSGGSEYVKGSIDLNPSKIEYMLNGYFGGMFNVINELSKMGQTIVGMRDFDPSDWMGLTRVLRKGGEENEGYTVRQAYYKLQDDADKVKSSLSNYNKDKEKYADDIKKLEESDRGQKAKIVEEYRKRIKSLTSKISQEDDEEKKKELKKKQIALMKEVLDKAYGRTDEAKDKGEEE